jgi:hypothetical protein
VPLFTYPNGSVITSPIIDTTNAQTSVIVRSGQTIVLGGMITSNESSEERKVPLLGDLPIVGQLFRHDLKRSRRSELLIFLTPRIVHNDEEAEMIKEIEAQRINFIEAEAELMHGPLYGVPAPAQGPGGPVMLPESPMQPEEGLPNGGQPNDGSAAPRRSRVTPAAGSDEDDDVPTTFVDQDAALAVRPPESLEDKRAAPRRLNEGAGRSGRKSSGLFKKNR